MWVTAGFPYVITQGGRFTWTWKRDTVYLVSLWVLSLKPHTRAQKAPVKHYSLPKTPNFVQKVFEIHISLIFSWDYHSCNPQFYYGLTHTVSLIIWPVSVHCFEGFDGLHPACRPMDIFFSSLHKNHNREEVCDKLRLFFLSDGGFNHGLQSYRVAAIWLAKLFLLLNYSESKYVLLCNNYCYDNNQGH